MEYKKLTYDDGKSIHYCFVFKHFSIVLATESWGNGLGVGIETSFKEGFAISAKLRVFTKLCLIEMSLRKQDKCLGEVDTNPAVDTTKD